MKNETKKISPYRIQNFILPCLDHPIPKEDFANRNKKLSENEASGNKEILS